MPRKHRARYEEMSIGKWADENYNLKRELVQNNGGEMPWTPAFTTSRFEESDDWSEESPPDILFYFQPPTIDEDTFYEPQTVVDGDGNIVMSPHQPDRGLRNIPILPDRISVDVPGWLMVAWRRLDPRIVLQDFIDRMTTNLGDVQVLTGLIVALPSKNTLQNRCTRNCRKVLHYFTEFAAHIGDARRAEVEAVNGLTTNHFTYNTTLRVHPQFKRLVKVRFTRKGGQMLKATPLHVTADNVKETTYPLDWFLYDGYQPQISAIMSRSVSTLLMLQERAMKHGLKIDDWNKLDRSCLPASWFDRTGTQTPPNGTFNGGCIYCTWVCGDDDDWECYRTYMGEFGSNRPKMLGNGVDEEKVGADAVDSCDIDNDNFGIGFDELFEAEDLPSSPLAALPRKRKAVEMEAEEVENEDEDEEEEEEKEEEQAAYPALPEIEWEQDEFVRPRSNSPGPMLPSFSVDDEEELMAFARSFLPAAVG